MYSTETNSNGGTVTGDMDVALIGASMTDFGVHEAWLDELLAEAAESCLADAGVERKTVDHLYVANMASGEFEGSTGVMNALAAQIGLTPAYAQRVDQTSASGGAGLVAACQSVAAGASEMTLLVGGEKMTNRSTGESADIIASLTHPYEYKHGLTLPSFAGLAAQLYLSETSATRESLARIAVKNHDHGRANPCAQFQREVDVETVLSSPIVADPLCLYDFCPITDGAAAILVCPADVAREYTDEFVTVAGMGGASDTHVVHDREDLIRMQAVERSGRQAFEQAGWERDADEVDVAELHDMATVLEALELEALGFAEFGEGWRLAEEGTTALDGSLPVNPSGGLKARGHPLGATGVAQIVELYWQLLGRADGRQVAADRGLACTVGGFGNCVTTALLEVAG